MWRHPRLPRRRRLCPRQALRYPPKRRWRLRLPQPVPPLRPRRPPACKRQPPSRRPRRAAAGSRAWRKACARRDQDRPGRRRGRASQRSRRGWSPARRRRPPARTGRRRAPVQRMLPRGARGRCAAGSMGAPRFPARAGQVLHWELGASRARPSRRCGPRVWPSLPERTGGQITLRPLHHRRAQCLGHQTGQRQMMNRHHGRIGQDRPPGAKTVRSARRLRKTHGGVGLPGVAAHQPDRHRPVHRHGRPPARPRPSSAPRSRPAACPARRSTSCARPRLGDLMPVPKPTEQPNAQRPPFPGRLHL